MKNLKIIVLFLFFILTFCFLMLSSTKFSVDILATKILSKCATAPVRLYCYEAEIPKLMSTNTMEDVFAVTKKVQDEDTSFLYCHNLAHKLSEIESKKIGWKDTALHCPLAMCNYGCLHGAFAQRFRGDVLTDTQLETVLPEILSVCEPREGYTPTDIDLAMCYHGIGHLAMFVTGGKPDRAISICEKIKTKSVGISYTRLCIEGAFMTVFQGGIDPEDIALVRDIKPTRENIVPFCAKYPAYWDICRHESYALYFDDKKTPEDLVKFCSYAINRQMKEYCYLGVIGIFTTQAFSESNGLEQLDRFCKGLPGEDIGLCFKGSALRLLQVDPIRYVNSAKELCNLSELIGDAECYKAMVHYADFIFGTTHMPERENYCQALPDKWKSSCLDNQK